MSEQWHPHAPGSHDPHDVLVVFRWQNDPETETILVGVHPYKGKETKIGFSRDWHCPRSRCRLIDLYDNESRLPESLRSVLVHARMQPNYLTLKWFAMLTPEEAETLMKLGNRL